MPSIDPRWEYASVTVPVAAATVKVTASRDAEWIYVSMNGLFSLRILPEAAATLCTMLAQTLGMEAPAVRRLLRPMV